MYIIIEKSELRENVDESHNAQRRPTSGVDHQPQQEEHQLSQHNRGIGQSCGNESNYAGLMERQSTTVHQEKIYSQLHIYGNAHFEHSVNERDIQLEEQSPENPHSIDICPINLNPEGAIYSTEAQL